MKRATPVIVFVAITALTLYELHLVRSDGTKIWSIDGWFYPWIHRENAPLSAYAMLFGALVALSVGGFARDVPFKLPLIVCGGVAMQFGCAMLEGHGLLQLHDRALNVGHTAFARTAVSGVPAFDIMAHYENWASNGRLSVYERTKPPGTLLFYVAWERLAHLAYPYSKEGQRLDWFATVTSFAWPLFASMSVWPLFHAARAMFDRERAYAAAALAVTFPSIVLITMHTDQVLFPMMVNLTLATIVLAAMRESMSLAVLSGVLTYAMIYCSFGLLPAIPVLVTGAAVAATKAGQRIDLTLPRVFLYAFSAFVVCFLLLRLCFQYDFFLRYARASHAHLAWKEWHGTSYEIRHYAFMNSLEYVVWIGVPVATFAVIGALVGFFGTRLRPFKLDPLVFATSILAVIFVLAWFGRTKAESARLWLFLAQPACLAAAVAITRVFKSNARAVLYFTLVAEIASTIMMKLHMDFW